MMWYGKTPLSSECKCLCIAAYLCLEHISQFACAMQILTGNVTSHVRGCFLTQCHCQQMHLIVCVTQTSNSSPVCQQGGGE